MLKTLSTLFVLTLAMVTGQRPGFAGSRPIGYPSLPNRTTTPVPDGLADRFGEVTTQKLPLEALGDRDLVDRLSKLPIDKQPFWFINWQHLEEIRKNPQSYPQRPSGFADPIPQSSFGTGTSSNNQGFSNNNQGFSNNAQGFTNNQGFPNNNQGPSNNAQGFTNNQGFSNNNQGFPNNQGYPNSNQIFSNNNQGNLNNNPSGGFIPNNSGFPNSNSGLPNNNNGFVSNGNGFPAFSSGFVTNSPAPIYTNSVKGNSGPSSSTAVFASPKPEAYDQIYQHQNFVPTTPVPNKGFQTVNSAFSNQNLAFANTAQAQQQTAQKQDYVPTYQGVPVPSNGLSQNPAFASSNQRPQEQQNFVTNYQGVTAPSKGFSHTNVSKTQVVVTNSKPDINTRFASIGTKTSSETVNKSGDANNYQINHAWNHSFNEQYFFKYNYTTKPVFYTVTEDPRPKRDYDYDDRY